MSLGAKPPLVWDAEIEPLSEGMTMRQWYKGQAMQGNMAFCGLTDGVDSVVGFAGKIADAMIAEDEKHAKGTDAKA